LNPHIFEILSFDSRQVYKYLEYGTTKPSPELCSQIKHHLVDFLEPSENLDAKKFIKIAKESLQSILDRGKIPIITCGTGFYLKAFLYGMFPVPNIPEEILKQVSQWNSSEKWENLISLDPECISRLHPNDEYRVSRALALNLVGVKWSSLQENREEGLLNREGITVKGYFLDWDREELYRRINHRAKEIIINQGILEETKWVIERYGKDCPALKSLGYNFVIEYLEGSISKDTLLEKFSQSHRNYAKKQITWFKSMEILDRISYQDVLEKFTTQYY
jgi:tRNA dimethylallyltransferase